MKVNDFKLLATLPEEYDYELFPQLEGRILIIGRLENSSKASIVGYMLENNELKNIVIDQRTIECKI